MAINRLRQSCVMLRECSVLLLKKMDKVETIYTRERGGKRYQLSDAQTVRGDTITSSLCETRYSSLRLIGRRQDEAIRKCSLASVSQ